MLKKVLLVIAILLVTASLVMGCKSSTSTTTPPTTPPVATSTPLTTTTTQTSTPVTTQSTTPTSTRTTQSSTTVPTQSATPSTTTPVSTTTTTTPKPSPTVSKSGGTLRWIDPTSPATAIGWVAESAGAVATTPSEQLCLQFPFKEMKDGSMAPNLAESYDVVTDPANASITLHFRKGVKFHDGTDFNAQAAKWNLEQVKAGGMVASASNNWKSFDVVDDYTLRINLVGWSNSYLGAIADSTAYMISPTAFEKNGLDWMRNNQVGTGPFKQVSYQRDVSLTVTRNENYFESGKPYLDKIQLLYVSDELTRLALFKSGGAEVLNLGGNPLYAGELQAAGYKIITRSGKTAVLIPDSANPDSPWSDVKVRQAAEYAIDKEAIARTLGYGFYSAAYQLNSPDSIAYTSSIPGRKYDLAKAKQLMSESGYPNGFKTSIIFQVGGNMNIPVSVQAYLAKIGIQAQIDVKEPAAYAVINTGTWKNGLVLHPIVQEWANPNRAFSFFWGSPVARFKSMARPDGWAEALAASLKTAKPEPAAAQKLETIAYENTMNIPLYYAVSLWAVTPNVQDSGIGTRGDGIWWEPQNTWLSK